MFSFLNGKASRQRRWRHLYPTCAIENHPNILELQGAARNSNQAGRSLSSNDVRYAGALESASKHFQAVGMLVGRMDGRSAPLVSLLSPQHKSQIGHVSATQRVLSSAPRCCHDLCWLIFTFVLYSRSCHYQIIHSQNVCVITNTTSKSLILWGRGKKNIYSLAS